MSNEVIPDCEGDDLGVVDLGNAKEKTKQVWFGPYPDSQYGNGAFPGL